VKLIFSLADQLPERYDSSQRAELIDYLARASFLAVIKAYEDGPGNYRREPRVTELTIDLPAIIRNT
jgi:hypothetical protein